ncbi:hypothetical protein HK405_013773 [Cladochytrium tenue]|nr:hypothetical protein HK405_013773 [Cladochytrium tenue]
MAPTGPPQQQQQQSPQPWWPRGAAAALVVYAAAARASLGRLAPATGAPGVPFSAAVLADRCAVYCDGVRRGWWK